MFEAVTPADSGVCEASAPSDVLESASFAGPASEAWGGEEAWLSVLRDSGGIDPSSSAMNVWTGCNGSTGFGNVVLLPADVLCDGGPRGW